jgi:fatty-acyl-CoA synthase
VDLFGSKIGVVCGDKQFTYREFGTRAETLASALTRTGMAKGDRVAYLSFNTHQLLEGYYGVVQAGGIVMPLNVRLSVLELTNILNHSGASMVIFEPDFEENVGALRAACPNVERWVTTADDRTPNAELTYEELLAEGKPERLDIFTVDENAIAELFYTSGSTGTPKGVTHTNRTLYLHALSVGGMYREVETMVDLHTIPLFHANGWGRPQASVLLGIKQVMVRRFEPSFVFRMIQEHKATDMGLVPTMANAIINCADHKNWNTSTMRRIMVGGAAPSVELIDRIEKAFPGAEAFGGYGLTETAPVLTSSRPKGIAYGSDAERLRRQASAGWPVPGVEVRVVDPDMNDVPRDMQTIGEVIAMGDHIMAGYYKEPEATAAVMTGPWFHTGDMAVWDEENYLHIVDRKKEIIISGGENISSIEVEKAIFSHPDVFECAVVAAPDDKWGEVPAAIVVPKEGTDLSVASMHEYLGTRLGRYKLPRIIVITHEPLPKTGTGKIKKMVLKEQFWVGKEKRVQG